MSETDAHSPKDDGADPYPTPTGAYATPINASRPPTPLACNDSSRLLASALGLSSQLDTTAVLEQLVVDARALTGARYAALGILDSLGNTVDFVFTGIDDEQARFLTHPPHGHGIFSLIPPDAPIRIAELTEHPAFAGFPKHHPKMGSFIGVPVRIHKKVFGRLYLTDKPGGFSEQDGQDLMVLAEAAAVAVENGRLYRESQVRERWLTASQTITTALLEGTDEEEALALITRELREVANADTALLVLPSIGNTWACEFADGHNGEQLVGTVFPPDGRAVTVLREGKGLLVNSLASQRVMRVEQLRDFGPALYAPLVRQGQGMGVLVLLRCPRGREFDSNDLSMAESVASQAALALELAQARHADDVAALAEERNRIGRDLHDLAVQQLFATGMALESTRTRLQNSGADEDTIEIFEHAITSVDDSVRQIRSIIHSLREPETAEVLVERLRREASLARTMMGFAPSLIITLDGKVVDGDTADDATGVSLDDQLDARVGTSLAGDIGAVVREGLANVSRHAHASSVQVRVSVSGRAPEGRAIIEVEDDGVGPDPSVDRRSGLRNLAARARLHSGKFSLEHGPGGRGALMRWEVPLT